jgi:hypothetical protein
VDEDEEGSVMEFHKYRKKGGSSQNNFRILYASISGAIERSRYLHGVYIGSMPVYLCISDERL